MLVPLLLAFGHFPTLDWLKIVPLILLFTLFNAGVALVAARLTVHVTDLTQLLPFVSRLLFYTSGVLFDVDRILANHPRILQAYNYHPLYQVLTMTRHYIIGSAGFPIHYWIFLPLISVGVFVLGAFFFWDAEERYGRE